MKIKIWGARGSIPTPMTTDELRDRLRAAIKSSKGINLDDPVAIERHIDRLPASVNTVVSGNTSCVELRAGDAVFIFDMGSGMRLLGKKLMAEDFARGKGTAHILISHTHYDHLEGFPFFVPVYIPGNCLNFYSPIEDLQERLHNFMCPPYFPVDLTYPPATRTFTTLPLDKPFEIAGVQIETLELNHPGKSYAFRMTHDDKVMVYASDGEYKNMDHEHTARFEHFFRDADLLIFDAMYTYEDVVTSKVDWGHSTAKVGAELAWRASVKRLLLTHHDPISTPDELWSKIADADHHLRYRAARAGSSNPPIVEVILAQEGLTIEI